LKLPETYSYSWSQKRIERDGTARVESGNTTRIGNNSLSHLDTQAQIYFYFGANRTEYYYSPARNSCYKYNNTIGRNDDLKDLSLAQMSLTQAPCVSGNKAGVQWNDPINTKSLCVEYKTNAPLYLLREYETNGTLDGSFDMTNFDGYKTDSVTIPLLPPACYNV